MTSTSPSAAERDEPGAAEPASSDGYREYVPPMALRRYVDCFWSATPPRAITAGAVRRVLPDGCVDIILESEGELERSYVVGTMTRPLVVPATAQSSFVGIRFRPGVAHTMFGVPAADLTDLRAPLAELWHDAEAAFDGVRQAADVTHRVRAVERMLVRRVAVLPAPAAEVGMAVQMIVRVHGNLSVAALGPALGVTRQHLARCFARDVGVSPKMFARVARMRAVVRGLHRVACADVDWSTLALDAGFYDQSHLVQDFKTLTGLTPGQWMAGR